MVVRGLRLASDLSSLIDTRRSLRLERQGEDVENDRRRRDGGTKKALGDGSIVFLAIYVLGFMLFPGLGCPDDTMLISFSLIYQT